MKNVLASEIRFKGQILSSGLAIGTSFFHAIDSYIAEDISILEQEVEKEIKRFKNAIKLAKKDLMNVKRQFDDVHNKQALDILDAQLEMFNDPLLIDSVEKGIKSKKKTADFILQQEVKEIKKKFDVLEDEIFKERFKDLQDVTNRILNYLKKDVKQSLPDFARNSILFVDDLTPLETVEASDKKILAIVSQRGSDTAHSAILARAKDIPYITNIPINLLTEHANSSVIVDGKKGELIINPEPKTLAKYKKLLNELLKYQTKLKKIVDDGERQALNVYANVEHNESIDDALQTCFGIGLFRSESILANTDRVSTEEEQFEIYQSLVKKMNGKPVTIRVFDVGRDKVSLLNPEKNYEHKLFGFRSMAWLEIEKQMYLTQLKVIYRVSQFGPIKILFPMIASLSELLEAKKIAMQASQSVKCTSKVDIGCMIELPAAAMIVDLLANECDFLSIGTNDLVQYSLAIDRCDHSMNHLYQPLHPGIIRLLRHIVKEAEKANIAATICGEIAANPKIIPLLVGLGFNNVSVSTRYIPLIKETVKGLNIDECKGLAQKVLGERITRLTNKLGL